MAESLDFNSNIPWLDEEYLKKILQKFTGNQFKDLQDFTIINATEKGENYVSAVHLLTCKYTINSSELSNETSFIVKSRLDNEFMSQIEEELNVFDREAQYYSEIMEKSEELLKTINDHIIFGPRIIYIDDRIIVQENLKLKGYAIDDVQKGLNFVQCKMILEKLAKFHATSMVLYKKNPDMFRYHLPGNVSENPTPLHDLYKNTIRTCIDYCRTQPDLQEYVNKLECFGDKIIPKMINVFSRNLTDRYHVLNHGDLWVNNAMFRLNDNKDPQDVIFVDFQEGFFGSPGIDLNYFIFSSWQSEVFEKHFDDLIKIYHTNLVVVLEKLNYPQRIPTIEDVKREIINKGFHGITTATCLLPILINEHRELSDPTNFLFDTEEAINNRKIVFNNPKFCEKLKLFLNFFKNNGVLQ